MAIVDVTSVNRNLKARLRVAQFGNFLQARTRPELYTAETFYTRLTRGERSDAITILDTKTLLPLAEIPLPGGKRSQSITQPSSFQFTDGDRMGLLFNFNPATSVTVIDLVGRKVLNEVSIPGCTLIYPTGQRGFFSLCSNGGFSSFQLDAAGKVVKQIDAKPFNDIEKNPMFMMSATIKGTTYFPTFQGQVRPIDVSRDAARVLPAWSLVSDEEARAGWRPSGWQVVAAGPDRLYVLMQPNGKEGSHKDGGTEVWVFDVAAKKRLQRITLKQPAISIEVTRGAKPLLVAATGGGTLDVYDAASGTHQRALGAGIATNPLVLYPVR